MHDPLGVHARPTAFVTDGQHLGHILGAVAERGDGLEWPPQVVGVQTCDDHLLLGRGELFHGVDEPIVEELALIDPDDPCAVIGAVQELRRRLHRDRLHLEARMRDHLRGGVPDIEPWQKVWIGTRAI